MDGTDRTGVRRHPRHQRQHRRRCAPPEITTDQGDYSDGKVKPIDDGTGIIGVAVDLDAPTEYCEGGYYDGALIKP
ncbi:hypothetical protein [Actinomadura opuntiae]|uniref:hypothetical protein n=1 Tax=Actinomadura sp. OS1-43 TaxID=604315 RepID=UPI00255ABB71|nr:hypothetical protein [Actinomadura sp. OS1-43]MDL4814018.1 hypothetical protein [Actinomadura sp. OS1-43]